MNQYTKNPLYVSETELQCGICKEIKKKEEFPKNKSQTQRGGFYTYCKVCASARTRAQHAERRRLNKNDFVRRKKSQYLKSQYGVTLDEYEQKRDKQGVCAICENPFGTAANTHLDHCHSTGKIRDFLCGNCNRGIGSFLDDTTRLQKAISYLEKHKGKHEETE